MTARLVAAVVTGLVLVGCTSADPQQPSHSATTSPSSPQAEPLRYEVTTCPIPDEASAARLLGSFELTLEDDWRIGLWYRGLLDEPVSSY